MNPQQLAKLMDQVAPALILFARQWCDAPEDVVQDAFLKLVRQKSPPGNPVAWLHQVVRNRAIDAGKSGQRRREREAAVARRWFNEPESDGLDAESAVRALEQLTADQREVVVSHLWGGLSFEQIALLTHCSASTAFRRFQ